ncbi:MAG TPA: cytochrome C, partial [Paraburkholderia sp.]
MLAALILPVREARCAPAAPPVAAASAGKALYQQGVLSSGEPLEAMHDGGVRLQGAAAACMNCHRPSGLGSREGNSSIPPIAWRYLVEPRVQNPEDADLPYVPGMRAEREPYTEATVARA